MESSAPPPGETPGGPLLFPEVKPCTPGPGGGGHPGALAPTGRQVHRCTARKTEGWPRLVQGRRPARDPAELGPAALPQKVAEDNAGDSRPSARREVGW